MKLNKKGRPYIEPDQPKRCVIKDKSGWFYHPTKAPDGLSKCGVMLQLNTKKTPHIFESRARALHAREHTIRFLVNSGLPFDGENFIVEAV